jgi:hypothetical protein
VRIAVLGGGPAGPAGPDGPDGPGGNRALEIVAELPVTKMGKLDDKALRDMLAGRSTS